MLLHLFHKFKTHYINGVHFGDQQQRWIRVHWGAPDMTQQCVLSTVILYVKKTPLAFSMSDVICLLFIYLFAVLVHFAVWTRGGVAE